MAAAKIYGHDRINLAGGVLNTPTLLWGQNALQTITITRNTPRGQQQAIGYLGIVDYTRGVVTSDVSLDTILVEHNAAPTLLASADSSVLKYAGLDVDLAGVAETYALTSVALALSAGNPATVNYGWLSPGLASSLAIKAAPAVSEGDVFAMVLGDEGSGLSLVAEWNDMDPALPADQGPAVSTIPTLDANGGVVNTLSDSGLPAGVQSVNLTGNINRDQVVDVRATRPCAFVTTYPVDVGMDMEVYQLPDVSLIAGTPNAWNFLKSLSIVSAADPLKIYAKIVGLSKQRESESVSTGKYISYSVSFQGSDLWIPLKSQP